MISRGAIQLFDLAICACVETALANDPPAAPAIGQAFIVGNAPTGAWGGRAQHLAGWTAGGWRFVPPVEGLTALVRSSGVAAIFVNGSWDVGTVRAASLRIGGTAVVGGQGAAVSDPAGGSTVDTQVRNAVVQILQRLRAHGLIAT